jgi:hypothetical protein
VVLVAMALVLGACSSSGAPDKRITTLDPNIPSSDQGTYNPTEDPPPRYDPPAQSSDAGSE